MDSNVIVIVGMQFGSEGKGKIAGILCEDADYSVRVGGINAGHSVYYKGERYAMQSIPVGFINTDCKLIIGAGSLISESVLAREIAMLQALGIDVEGRLIIDPVVGIIDPKHAKEESAMSLNSILGSTCKGVGTASSHRIMRSLPIAQDIPALKPYIKDTITILNREARKGRKIVIEGTQGIGLSLTSGRQFGIPFYPKTTSRDITPMAIMSDCGLSIKNYKTVGVMRTYPIRVGWKSAGEFGTQELDWEIITERCGCPFPLEERTTVTKMVRRVAENDLNWMREVCENNAIDEIAWTFADYVDWKAHGTNKMEDLPHSVVKELQRIQNITDTKVSIISTGGEVEATIRR